GGLREIVREVGRLARPILEGAAKAMNRDTPTQITQQHEQCHVGKRPPLLLAEEHELAELDLSHLFKNFDDARRERYAMIIDTLHSLARHKPDASFEVNLVPAHTKRLTSPCRGQNCKLKSSRADA